MRSFFALASKSGTFAAHEVEHFREIVEGTIAFQGHVKSSSMLVSDSGRILLYALTNEPGVEPVEGHDQRSYCFSGQCRQIERVVALKPTQRLARDISTITGRFCLAVLDDDCLAVANTVTRVDPIFNAETDRYHIVGTQASTVGCLRNGRVDAYDIPALFTFINTGFFGVDATAFLGVSALPPLSTLIFRNGLLEGSCVHLADLKDNPPTDAIEQCTTAYADAMTIISSDGPVKLGITGGKDSRLILAALLRAGIPVETFTIDRGAANSADVYVAASLTKRLGIPHSLRPELPSKISDGGSRITVDLLNRAAQTLRATDCGAGVYSYVRFHPEYKLRAASLTGLGGEVMRGGYAEHHKKLSGAECERLTKRQFGRFCSWFKPAAQDEFLAHSERWLQEYLPRMTPPDTMDCLYIYYRCGRWLASTSRGTTVSGPTHYPMLDNRLTWLVASIPVQNKLGLNLIRPMLRRLNPVSADFPLAMEDWPDSNKEERAASRQEYPDAFRAAPPDRVNLDWRSPIAPEVLAHIKRYCLDEGRVGLLSPIMDEARAAEFLKGEATQNASKNFLFGLYSACVMLSGDWRGRTLPKHSVAVSL